MDYIIIAIVVVIVLIAIIPFEIIIMKTIKSNNATLLEFQQKNTNSGDHDDYRILTVKEAEEVIDNRITELWTQKYMLYYKIKGLRVIPNMDTEIENFTEEVLESFAPRIRSNILHYYNKPYLVKMITRKAQLLMMDYLNANKPNTK